MPFLPGKLIALTVALSAFASATAAPTCETDDSRADFLLGLANGVDLDSSPGDVILQGSPAIDQQNTALGTSGVGITTTTWGGQTFTPSVSGKLTQVEINLFCSGCTGTTPDLTVSLQATSGGLPTGPDLASATIAGFSNGSSANFYPAFFASPATVSAGVQYALVIRPTANPSPGTYALTRSGTSTTGSDAYSGGTRVAGATSGTVWSIPLTGGVSTDAGFKVYIAPGYVASGSFISRLFDNAPVPGTTPTWTLFTRSTSIPTAATDVRFQAAASNSSSGPFNFVGPDGTSGTTYSPSDTSISQFNGMRYLKYKALLTSTDAMETPSLQSAVVCYDRAVIPAPVVSSLSPLWGPPAGGNIVVVTGTGFTAATKVSFGAASASTFTVDSDSQITAVAPAGAVGTVDVTVTTDGGTSVVSAADKYAYAVRQTSAIPTALGGQIVSAQIVSGSAGCSIDLGNTVAFTPPAFNGATPPYGGLKLVLTGCQNSETARVSITWPSTSGLVPKKYGKTPTSPGADVYYDPSNVSVSGNTVSYDITDNGLGDDTFTGPDGIINDPAVMVMAFAPASTAAPIPTLSEWALIGLSLVLALVGLAGARLRVA